jgi:anthranilate synthase/aminodeoxychorismate synthase-like glutamine amidotransferase
MILMVDNYDSFTYNLVQMLTMAGARVEVLRNDAESAEAMLARSPEGIVLSPGPGRPEDAGVCLDLIRRKADVPLLGVCLGHQALGMAFGATVDRAPRLMHGKTSPVRHGDQGVFAGLPNPFEATRYHSLEVKEGTLPAELEPLAWADDGTLMGLRHRALPYWGVQFHPESVLTGSGPRLLANFMSLCQREAATPS